MNNQPMHAPINIGAIQKQIETAPFVTCGAEPEQQAFKRNIDEWLCEDCYGKISHEPEIKTIPNNFGHKCARCGNEAKYLISGYETCTSREFTKIFMFKTLSSIVSPNGKEQTVELQVLKCAICGAQKVVKT